MDYWMAQPILYLEIEIVTKLAGLKWSRITLQTFAQVCEHLSIPKPNNETKLLWNMTIIRNNRVLLRVEPMFVARTMKKAQKMYIFRQ